MTLQGFIAFVAFIDIATALRNYVERRSFMSGNEEFTDVKLIEGNFRLNRFLMEFPGALNTKHFLNGIFHSRLYYIKGHGRLQYFEGFDSHSNHFIHPLQR